LVIFSRRTLLHNIRRPRRRWEDNIKVNIKPRERCLQGFGGETCGEDYTWKRRWGIILRWIFRKWNWESNGLIWLTVGKSGRLL
jgi:hypothetical protein